MQTFAYQATEGALLVRTKQPGMEQDALVARVAELERQSGAVFVLQQVLSTMSATLELDDLLSIIIRGIGEALDFSRIVLFTVGSAGEVMPRLQLLPDGSVTSGDAIAFHPADSLMDVAQGKQELVFADPAIFESPLPDTTGTFCIVPLTARDTVRGVFYVDRASVKDIDEFELGMLLIFASQAAIAI
jgi:GAF domain-containing protein